MRAKLLVNLLWTRYMVSFAIALDLSLWASQLEPQNNILKFLRPIFILMVQKLFLLLNKWRPIRLRRYYTPPIQYSRFQREIVEIEQ